jgi:hypothetical protein
MISIDQRNAIRGYEGGGRPVYSRGKKKLLVSGSGER